jgi:ArsR family transcriptional regulator
MTVDTTVVDTSMRLPDPTTLRVSKALSDPTRFEILRAIAGREEISCQELTSLFSISQATVSHHLKVLTDAGLVSARKQGPFHYYRAHHDAIAAHARVLTETFLGVERRPARTATEGPAQAGARDSGAGMSRGTGPRSRRRG